MPTTRLYATASVEEQWQAVAKPWLLGQAGTAWKDPRPTVILTPSRAEGFYLQSRLLTEGIPAFGLRFWTPSDARKFLLAELLPEMNPATLADQRLVARACAEKLAASATTDNATLASVVREPGAFLRAYDLLIGAGWDPAQEGAAYGRNLAREMHRALEKGRIATQAGVHQHLRRAAATREKPLIAHLLVIGFNAAHWPLWDLLKGLAFSAGESTVSLLNPRFFSQEIDQLWTSSWEEITHSTVLHPTIPEVEAGVSLPFTELVASYEKGEVAQSETETSAELGFLVTRNLASQVRAIVLQVIDYLGQESCTRLGIVFAEANALALGVAEELRRLAIPLDDGTGTLMPGIFEQRSWTSWIALQEEPNVPKMIAWVRACEAEGVACGEEMLLTAREIADVLDAALGESLVDDLNFLARHLEEDSGSDKKAAVADLLHKRIPLPGEATFAKFYDLTQQALALPGWEEHLERLKIGPPEWLYQSKQPISRRIFLEWLKESTASQTRTRGTEGNHFYGKVHLIIYAQMSGQTWSHLILTGLNEGVWPRVHEAGAFGSRHELAVLNLQARVLNRRVEQRGSQGEGHDIVSKDRGHCLLPLERQDLALRDLCAALESTRISACLTAMTTENGQGLLPSDFFNHAYQSQTGRALDEKSFRSLAAATETWCRQHEALFKSPTLSSSLEIQATTDAYKARRDITRPFGPYEFAYEKPPLRLIQLSCKRWEDAWNHPATVWLNEIVGALEWPEGTLSWSRAIGTWVHRWLAAALRECKDRNLTNELPVLVWDTADRDAQATRNHARNSAIVLYPWWEPVWRRAKTRSLQVSESLAPLLTDHLFFAEFTLPNNLMVALPGSEEADFRLKGRIDFLRVEEGEAEPDAKNPNFNGCHCWVIDFKTGSSKTLTQKNILKGTGLQALLYARAIRALGASATSMSLLAPESEAKKQVELTAVLDPILAALGKLHREGIFGMRSDAGNDYGFASNYPIATQFILPSILEAKWALTHGIAGEGDA